MNVIKKINSHRVYVAVSGGVDSMVALHHLMKKHEVVVLHYVHSQSKSAVNEYHFVKEFCYLNCIEFYSETQSEEKTKICSLEEHWRIGRYKFFKKFSDAPIVTGHTLDDAVEWYLFSSFHGLGKVMEYEHANIIRPFLTTKKKEIVDYALKHKLDWLEDETNADVKFAARNLIRHNILPEVLKVNPGIYKVVKKKIIAKVKEQS